MIATTTTYHMSGVVEPVGWTVLETSVVANCHEVCGITDETCGISLIPTSLAGLVAFRTVHGLVGVIKTIIASTLFTRLKSTFSI